MSGAGERDALVRDQYEAYPYPPRNPADERKRLITGSPSHIDEINHYVFAGQRDFSAPFRALVAGGGTGDAAIMLAQQLADRGKGGQVVYIDMSETSRRIAEERARVRGLDNIVFYRGSLLDIGDIAPGPYDYIDCCGVLHHLEDPAAGLAALRAVMSDGGGMGIMLYGALGRTGVYPLQESLRLLDREGDLQARIALARRLLDDLPRSNWFRRNPLLGDHLLDNDAALYDLLLHSRDRAYRVGEIGALIRVCALAVTGFIEPLRYEPETYLDDEALIRRCRDLSFMERAALAENLCGTLKTHVFYLVASDRAADACARPGPGMVPVIRDQPAAALARALAGKRELKVDFDGAVTMLELPERAVDIVSLCDGRRDLETIRRETGMDAGTFEAAFATLYRGLNGINLLLLRDPA